MNKSTPIGTLIEDFNPKNKIFQFNLDKYCCCKKKTKKCFVNTETVNSIGNQYLYVSGYDKLYCPNIANNILLNGFDENLYPVMIQFNEECGHYSVSNGQHRLCLAAKLNMPIKVYLKEQDCKCRVCLLKEDLSYRIKDTLKMNKDFLEKL